VTKVDQLVVLYYKTLQSKSPRYRTRASIKKKFGMFYLQDRRDSSSRPPA